MATMKHWTSTSEADFVFRISSDFVAQIETKLEDQPLERQEYARMLGITPSAVSQTLNNPGNMEIGTMVHYARVLGMKIAVVAYEDNDPNNDNGPVSAQVFNECWKRARKPQDLYELRERSRLQRRLPGS